MSAVVHAALRQRPTFAVSCSVLFAFASCAAPAAAPLELHGVVAALNARDPRLAADSAELSGLQPLALAAPTAEELADPRTHGFWRGCALAWNPSVRAARRELSAAIASAQAAGKPGAIGGNVEVDDFEHPDDLTKVALSVDLLGLAGLGPTAAARTSADANVQRSRSAFERVLWGACFEVERARVRVGATQARVSVLETLLTTVQQQDSRLEILERRGRLSESEAQRARLAVHEVEHALSTERSTLAQQVSELAQASGLLPERRELSTPGAELLAIPTAKFPPVDAQTLLEQLPRLRELCSEYALAEARVREIASEAWPSLRAGPVLRFRPSDVLFGGMLDLSLPWPGSVQPRVRAAEQERSAARERLEDELLATLLQIASLREQLAQASLRAEEHALLIDDSAGASFQAATRQLHLGAADYFEWTMRLREAQMAALSLIEARAQVRLLALDLEEACGVRAKSAEVTP